jgi:hypothetical protein
MRFLNSILLEGLPVDQPSFSIGADGIARCSFTLSSGDDAPRVPVITYGRLAERCRDLLSKDYSTRVVGRLTRDLEASAETEGFKLHIVAEHVEINTSASRREAVA